MRSIQSRVSVMVAAVLCTAVVAMGAPPVLPAIDPPVDLASVGTSIATIGGAALLVWAAVKIGFRVAKKLIGKTSGAV